MSNRVEFDPVSLEIMWSRLLGIADDMWTTVLRTAVSTSIGASQDFGCEILDCSGSSVAHASRSMPVFNFVMPTVTRAIIDAFPVESMQPGDVFITNDPWLCAGHLDDIAVITPVFSASRVAAFAVSVAHASSIGGSLTKRMVHDVFEEGLRIPVLKLHSAGDLNETAWAFIRQNVRTPDMVMTDIHAQLSANTMGARRIEAFLEEYRLTDLTSISAAIQDRSEEAMCQAIRELPNGMYDNEIWADGLDQPTHLRCRVTIEGDSIEVDYAGTDPQRGIGGLDCTMVYTKGHTVYPLKCLLAPSVPASEGTLRPITITAPTGSMLNCDVPASVGSRTKTGWHLHSLLFGALAPILPERIQAGNGLMHTVRAYGQYADGNFFNAQLSVGGGRGASFGRDGMGRNCFPSSARNVPVEILENRAPVMVRRRALRPDSAGVGQWRGAFGHDIEFRIMPGHLSPVTFFLNPDWLRFAPRGLAGGEDGPRTEIIVNGKHLSREDLGSGQVTLASQSDSFEWHIPGGGGFGPRDRRNHDAIAADIQSGLQTPLSTTSPASD